MLPEDPSIKTSKQLCFGFIGVNFEHRIQGTNTGDARQESQPAHHQQHNAKSAGDDAPEVEG